jgi:hypothetical protein
MEIPVQDHLGDMQRYVGGWPIFRAGCRTLRF